MQLIIADQRLLFCVCTRLWSRNFATCESAAIVNERDGSILKPSFLCIDSYKASNVRTTVILPTKVATSLGLAVADHPSAFFTPNLHPYTVARLMLSSIDSGLSHYHVVPAFAAFIPWTRSLPLAYEEFLRWTSKLHEYVSEKTREVGRKGGYKITVDDDHE
jgi:hypothetical protein